MLRTPAGFMVLSACSFLSACMMAIGLGFNAADEIGPGGRLALAATGALALVTAEALLLVRPWTFSASRAFAVSFITMLFVVMSKTDDSVVAVAIVAIPIATALTFVYTGLRSIRAAMPGPQRVPAPRP